MTTVDSPSGSSYLAAFSPLPALNVAAAVARNRSELISSAHQRGIAGLGIAVLTNPANDALECLSFADLYALIGPEAKDHLDEHIAEAVAAAEILAATTQQAASAAEQLAHNLAAEWQKSYPKAATCLLTDLDACLRYFDYPPEHWKHLRTTNPVESTFSTMRLRTDAAKRFRTARSGVHLVFKLFHRYQKTWSRISAAEKLRDVLTQAKQKEKPVDKLSKNETDVVAIAA